MPGSKRDNTLWNAALFLRDEKKSTFWSHSSQVAEKVDARTSRGADGELLSAEVGEYKVSWRELGRTRPLLGSGLMTLPKV